MIPDDNRFESDPEQALSEEPPLPPGWEIGGVDATVEADVEQLTTLLQRHEEGARGWASSGRDDVLVEIEGTRMRENVVVRDPGGVIRAWGSVHDRAAGRMLFVHIVARDLPEPVADKCSTVLFEWAEAQAREVGAARGLATQQIDTGAFAADERQHKWLEGGGFARVRTWWQMTRPVTLDESDLVPDPDFWEADGVTVRLVRREGSGMPDRGDLEEVHQVIEGSFTDHFNHREETFAEFVHRLREDPGHRWDHWWLAEIDRAAEAAPSLIEPAESAPSSVEHAESGSSLVEPVETPPRDEAESGGRVPPRDEAVYRDPVGALVATASESPEGPDGSYVAYIGVLGTARGRGVATKLLQTVVADAAARGRNRVTLEVDADSPTGAQSLYTGMGWATSYVTESWHRDVPVQ
ncbi:GNAT family N-acetyltransferase [Nocardioides limicola]|uniref:GNAT family N-acetyltransferase n=1 Tax=Nocardioides limicola TaxID=2803368 RepID=UPI0027DD44E7|nr:GNAT family N-acetyltransferase [Nocardioides sp. DJM-14]